MKNSCDIQKHILFRVKKSQRIVVLIFCAIKLRLLTYLLTSGYLVVCNRLDVSCSSCCILQLCCCCSVTTTREFFSHRIVCRTTNIYLHTCTSFLSPVQVRLPGRVEVDDLDAAELLLPELEDGPGERVQHVQVAFDPRSSPLERAPLSDVGRHRFQRRTIDRSID